VLVLLVAWAAVAGALTALPRDRALGASTLATIGLVFLARATSAKSLMIIHYALALVAFTASLASTLAAVRWSRLNPSR
jgi:predicted tellurium resistance membrane protein TerC